MATKKVTRSKTQGKPAMKTPAEVLREQKAKIAESLKEGHRIPKLGAVDPILDAAVQKSAKARKALSDIPVPLTLGEVCGLIGPNCSPDDFAVTAFEALADQLSAVSTFAESTGDGGYEQWQVVDNIVARMRCARNVTALLSHETNEPAAVQP